MLRCRMFFLTLGQEASSWSSLLQRMVFFFTWTRMKDLGRSFLQLQEAHKPLSIYGSTRGVRQLLIKWTISWKKKKKKVMYWKIFFSFFLCLLSLNVFIIYIIFFFCYSNVGWLVFQSAFYVFSGVTIGVKEK